jgi:agmatinase
MRGAAKAPERIRQSLWAGASNLCAENGLNLEEHPRFVDRGDIVPGCGEQAVDRIARAVDGLLNEKIRVLTLGGDHAVTYPIAKAYQRNFSALNLLQLDAHPDLYDHYQGDRYSHACPFARIMEAGLARRLVQVGIRTLNAHQREQAQRFGVEIIEMRHWERGGKLSFDEPLYVSIDMDVFDPGFAPGLSHPEPGGATPRQVLELIQNLRQPLVGADIVEYNPRRDPLGLTAALAAKLLKEVAAAMLSGHSEPQA